MFDDKLGKYIVVGVVSYGIGCGELNTPGWVIYVTNVFQSIISL